MLWLNLCRLNIDSLCKVLFISYIIVHITGFTNIVDVKIIYSFFFTGVISTRKFGVRTLPYENSKLYAIDCEMVSEKQLLLASKGTSTLLVLTL